MTGFKSAERAKARAPAARDSKTSRRWCRSRCGEKTCPTSAPPADTGAAASSATSALHTKPCFQAYGTQTNCRAVHAQIIQQMKKVRPSGALPAAANATASMLHTKFNFLRLAL